ncbi:MAG: hypothetical protein GYA36_19260 [Veillonellaceae bacterium]|nr:hypothetical protein [Veillonellaceae bacterium]
MIPKSQLREWQRQLAMQPKVWVVEVQGEWTGNLYDSAEAASFEVEALQRWGQRRNVRAVCYGNLHNIDLSRQRWAR